MSGEAYSVIESRIQQAIHKHKGEIKPNIAAMARELDVPIDRLRARFKSRQSRQRPPPNRKLREDQEERLCDYLTKVDAMGIAPRYCHLNKYANSILNHSHDDPDTPPPTVSNSSTLRFLKKHPEFHHGKPKTLDINGKIAHHYDDLRESFP